MKLRAQKYAEIPGPISTLPDSIEEFVHSWKNNHLARRGRGQRMRRAGSATTTREQFEVKNSRLADALAYIRAGHRITIERKTSFLCFLIVLLSICSPRSARSVRSSHARAFKAIRREAPTMGSPSISCLPVRMKS